MCQVGNVLMQYKNDFQVEYGTFLLTYRKNYVLALALPYLGKHQINTAILYSLLPGRLCDFTVLATFLFFRLPGIRWDVDTVCILLASSPALPKPLGRHVSRRSADSRVTLRQFPSSLSIARAACLWIYGNLPLMCDKIEQNRIE